MISADAVQASDTVRVEPLRATSVHSVSADTPVRSDTSWKSVISSPLKVYMALVSGVTLYPRKALAPSVLRDKVVSAQMNTQKSEQGFIRVTNVVLKQ